MHGYLRMSILLRVFNQIVGFSGKIVAHQEFIVLCG